MRYQVIKFNKIPLEPGPCDVEELGSKDQLDESRALIPAGWIRVTFPDNSYSAQTFFPEDIVIYDKIGENTIEMYRKKFQTYNSKEISVNEVTI